MLCVKYIFCNRTQKNVWNKCWFNIIIYFSWICLRWLFYFVQKDTLLIWSAASLESKVLSTDKIKYFFFIFRPNHLLTNFFNFVYTVQLHSQTLRPLTVWYVTLLARTVGCISSYTITLLNMSTSISKYSGVCASHQRFTILCGCVDRLLNASANGPYTQ